MEAAFGKLGAFFLCFLGTRADHLPSLCASFILDTPVSYDTIYGIIAVLDSMLNRFPLRNRTYIMKKRYYGKFEIFAYRAEGEIFAYRTDI